MHTQRRILTRGARTAALLSVVALVGCSEDLGPVTATWTQLQSTMVAKAAELRRQYESISASVKALPPVSATDSLGQSLTAKLGAALSAHASLLGGLDTNISSAAASVGEAVKTGKVANIQKAIDAAKVAYDASVSKVAASGTGVLTLLSQLKAHNAALAAEAARVNTSGSKTDFNDIDFKPGKADFLFDRPTTQATLDKLLVFVNTCPELVVDLVGHTSNEGTAAVNQKLSVDRAKAVKHWLLGKGVGAKKIHGVSGVGATDNAVPEPDAKTAAAKMLPAAALEEIRRKNRRVTVVVVTPCTPHQVR
jgi:outer membrane protein OmpA-like peptidoglycan-associated protein